jgi:hypothetical protein
MTANVRAPSAGFEARTGAETQVTLTGQSVQGAEVITQAKKQAMKA